MHPTQNRSIDKKPPLVVQDYTWLVLQTAIQDDVMDSHNDGNLGLVSSR